MPELPEVETIRRQLGPALEGRAVLGAGAHPSSRFASAVEAVGAGVEVVRRRGKYLLVGLDDQREVVVHLGMTGQLRTRDGGTTDPDDDVYVRAWWNLDDGRRLELRDVRRFGRVAVLPAGSYASIPTLAGLGPEPLSEDFDPVAFWHALRSSRARLKTQLLSQRPVAGVGNIYADEALWEAGIHPGRRTVTPAEAARLHGALREVLAEAIGRGGTTLRDYRTFGGETGTNQHHLRCYGRAAQPCRRCGAALRRLVYDGRTTTFCPECQRNR